MDKILIIKIMECILIWIVGVGATIKLMSGGVFYPVFVMSIPEDISTHGMARTVGTYTVLLFIIHEGGNGPTLVGMGPGELPLSWQSVVCSQIGE